MSTRYYSSSSICPYPPVPLHSTLRYFFLARALPRLCRALLPSFFFVRGARTTYIRGLSILSRLRSFSRFAPRSSFPLPSFSPTARAHSLSLPPSFSFLRSHRPSPSSFVLPLSLCPPLGSFLTLQPAAFPVPVSALLPRDSRIGSRLRPCARDRVYVWNRVDVCQGSSLSRVHVPRPGSSAPRFPGLAALPLPIPRPSSLSLRRGPLLLRLRPTHLLGFRVLLATDPPAPARSVVCPGVYETRERLGRGEFAFHRKALAGIGIYRGMERGA